MSSEAGLAPIVKAQLGNALLARELTLGGALRTGGDTALPSFKDVFLLGV